MNVSLFFVSGLIVFKTSKSEKHDISRISTPHHLSYLLNRTQGIDDPEDMSYLQQTPIYGD